MAVARKRSFDFAFRVYRPAASPKSKYAGRTRLGRTEKHPAAVHTQRNHRYLESLRTARCNTRHRPFGSQGKRGCLCYSKQKPRYSRPGLSFSVEICVDRILVRSSGFEPPRYCYRQPLKLVRLPVPPRPLTAMYLTSSEVKLLCEAPIIGAFHFDVNICAASSIDTGSARSRVLDTVESLHVYVFA